VVDLTKPCVKCGEVNRYSNGNCKPCQKKWAAKYRQSDTGRAKIRKYYQSDEGRAKIRKYRQSDEYRAKEREYRQLNQVRAKHRKYRQLDQVRAKHRKYRQSDEGRAKLQEYRRKCAQTAIGRQRFYAAQVKYKKMLFQFSLQNQQKVIEQCQQKTSGKEG